MEYGSEMWWVRRPHLIAIGWRRCEIMNNKLNNNKSKTFGSPFLKGLGVSTTCNTPVIDEKVILISSQCLPDVGLLLLLSVEGDVLRQSVCQHFVQELRLRPLVVNHQVDYIPQALTFQPPAQVIHSAKQMGEGCIYLMRNSCQVVAYEGLVCSYYIVVTFAIFAWRKHVYWLCYLSQLML